MKDERAREKVCIFSRSETETREGRKRERKTDRKPVWLREREKKKSNRGRESERQGESLNETRCGID